MRISDWSSDVCSSDLFGALSDIPREQPIRDNLVAIEERSRRIDRMLRITASILTEIEECVDALFGGTFFLGRPTPAWLAVWRAKAQAWHDRAEEHSVGKKGAGRCRTRWSPEQRKKNK